MTGRRTVSLHVGPVGLCGVDEAGRGPLAGPVVAAAVMLDPKRPIKGLRDSKKLTPAARERLADEIRARALAWCVAEASVAEIDRLNILHATMLAMQRAVAGMSHAPDDVWVDGDRCPEWTWRSQAVVQGDDKVAAIAAASILAKTVRDELMRGLHEAYPLYGFAQHMGYATAAHLAALKANGACPHHRRSFAPVRLLLDQTSLF
ncbi:ribonuclease H [Thiobacillus denitrificans ATCC 25259]|uniref:Ribonuclease HII n=1 Tax=Thiobacillus denitrificans (strain ATCC 25259 / T1) TaxID=292415 RepID=RNH2_THIDA|nr:ribonuclease HII [Thiobacillus denitrificans]Q3SKM7.1 RecName: Full=Ribonuclease HII; Short=RNase HII [Thiobacillus denitrificans ATCC 25259]AAZ96752.1 ribonuclease H [Thiobacillus denitrificans ATCC 25259]